MRPTKARRMLLSVPSDPKPVNEAKSDELDADASFVVDCVQSPTKSLAVPTFRSTPATQSEAFRMRGLCGHVFEQLAFLASLGFPEPRVVPVKGLNRLASLRIARQEWITAGGDPEAARVALEKGGPLDWNKRDPLSPQVFHASTIAMRDASARNEFVAFTSLPRGGTGMLPDPLSEMPQRMLSALVSFAPCPHYLVPSLVVGVDDPYMRVSAAAAMPLYIQLCELIVTFGGVPSIDEVAVTGFGVDVIDVEPQQKQKEQTVSTTSMAVDQDAVERCSRLWDEAELRAANLPKKNLPRFRALVPDP